MEEDPPTVPSGGKKPPSLWIWMLIGVPLALGIMTLIGYLWTYSDMAKGEGGKQTTACLTNLSQLGRASLMYAQDHDDLLPQGEWNQALGSYLKTEPDAELLFSCPVQRRIDPITSGYALNAALAGKRAKSVGPANNTILVFDSSAIMPNAIAPTSTMPYPGRHEHGHKNNVVYVDGHYASLPAHETKD